MGIIKSQRYCPTDNRMVLAERQTPNHVLHLLLAVVTAGIWLPIWLIVTLNSSKAFRCPHCGSVTHQFAPHALDTSKWPEKDRMAYRDPRPGRSPA